MIVSILGLTLATFIGGLGFRVRGGLWGERIGWGATKARFVAWATPMAFIQYFAWSQSAIWMIPIFIIAWWLGCLLPWWKSLDMGRDEGPWWKDFILHSVRGIWWCLPPVLVMWGLTLSIPFSTLLILGAGLLCGVVYEIGYQIKERVSDFMQGSEYGEIIFGALIAATTTLVLYGL